MPLPASPIALVHEWFTPRSVGGSELVVQALDRWLGQPHLHGLVDGESQRASSWLAGRRIQTSFIQHLPFGISHVQQYLPLLPLAIEQLDLSGYPLVISSSHLVAKGVLTSPDQCHISYVHTPVRYAWDQMHAYLRRSALAQRGLGALKSTLPRNSFSSGWRPRWNRPGNGIANAWRGATDLCLWGE